MIKKFCIFFLALTYFRIPFFFSLFVSFLTIQTFLFSYFLPSHPPLSKPFSYLLPSLENGATICYPSPTFTFSLSPLFGSLSCTKENFLIALFVPYFLIISFFSCLFSLPLPFSCLIFFFHSFEQNSRRKFSYF